MFQVKQQGVYLLGPHQFPKSELVEVDGRRGAGQSQFGPRDLSSSMLLSPHQSVVEHQEQQQEARGLQKKRISSRQRLIPCRQLLYIGIPVLEGHPLCPILLPPTNLIPLGYAPVGALSKDVLDETWEALYNPEKTGVALDWTSNAESYAVVSYVQYAGGKKPPATWTNEVDEVLNALVPLQIIADKAVWFDKLASRQYIDSQKWWGAAATMQFLFNPVIVLLPRMSEQESFRPTVGRTIWGGDEADKVFENFMAHAMHCENCHSSLALRWALQQDRVLPVAALRTWPRVEHALGDGGFGLFTSEATDGALAALLTCAFAMLSFLCRNDRNLHLMLCDAKLLPSSFIAEDGSVLIGWVQISCSDWQHRPASAADTMESLKGMASCMMELYHLFCKLQSPKQLSLQQSLLDRKDEYLISHEFKQVMRHEFRQLPSGLYYPELAPRGHSGSTEDNTDQDPLLQIDVPTLILARFQSNDTIAVHAHYAVTMPMSAFAFAQVYWAVANVQRNLTKRAVPIINNAQFLVARQQTLTTLVHSSAAQPPCYAWDDKLVAAILLSSPKVFRDAFQIWQNQNNGGNMLARLNKVLCDIGSGGRR
ncbi:hypothetical protein GOP47_0013569 [Adiantum capillus-veneris]|uniref:Uncharacterized protein n=1 Tax=Adiantum capillus-veneris TaxID=13818 RepID=A0A9D4ZDC2_ADICA|nr:hypothetical protein GOP47_0013569 [Adiantum capillus-veneris]